MIVYEVQVGDGAIKLREWFRALTPVPGRFGTVSLGLPFRPGVCLRQDAPELQPVRLGWSGRIINAADEAVAIKAWEDVNAGIRKGTAKFADRPQQR